LLIPILPNYRTYSGPNNSTIDKGNEIRANASGLTKGEYVFQVEIEDDAKLTAKAMVKVIVMQSKGSRLTQFNIPEKLILRDN
jgi:hypothetical protein